jgi:hypothetical protein
MEGRFGQADKDFPHKYSHIVPRLPVISTMVLHSWHRGEQAVHTKLHTEQVNAGKYSFIDDALPGQHRAFYKRNVVFLPVVTLDKQGRPWGSFAFSKSGITGFIDCPTEGTISMKIHPVGDDPLVTHLESHVAGGEVVSPLIAGVGIDFTNRRRNKFAGGIVKVEMDNGAYKLIVNVTEVIGYVSTKA